MTVRADGVQVYTAFIPLARALHLLHLGNSGSPPELPFFRDYISESKEPTAYYLLVAIMS